MNELATKQNDQLSAFDINPQNFKEAMEMCKFLSDCDFVPNAFKGKPANVFAAGCLSHSLGITLFQGIQNIGVVNGKATIYGDLGIALLKKAGCKIDGLDVDDIRKINMARCTITRPNGHSVTRTYSLEDAKLAGLWGKQGPWTTNPYRQMAWRAFWFAARDLCADLLHGLSGREEVEDYENVVEAEEVEEIAPPKRLSQAQSAPAPESTPAPAEPPPINEKEAALEAIQQHFPEATVAKEEVAPPPKRESKYDRSKMRAMNAKFSGKCKDCGGFIGEGAEIFYESNTKSAFHAVCEEYYKGDSK